ncbi:MAG: dihydroxyacetone kinase subunit L [Streptosporangiales bacterium]|nr:dihydroxyacetone kinase subunit L [Streptosporangiales bacterium]
MAREWVRVIAVRVSEQATYLGELDGAIGDGDHGGNLDRGFAAAVGKLDRTTDSAREVLTATGGALISAVGGASGPLYGTYFRKLARALPEHGGASAAELGAALQVGVDGVRALGGAAEGDKTMVDALVPAAAAFAETATDGLPAAAVAAAEAARRGADATVPLRARKGRASYLGERSEGHLDPGAASSALVLAALAEVVGG